MNRIIEKKKIKVSKRGVTFSFRDKGKSKFSIGNYYKYIIDVKNRKMVILPTEEGKGLKISRKKTRNSQKPLFDIRNKKVLSTFEGVDYLEITIYENKILVEGYVEKESNIVNRITNKIKNKILNRKTININSFLNVRKTSSILIYKDSLKMAVGNEYSQISFDEIFGSISTTTISTNISTTHNNFIVNKNKGKVLDFTKPFKNINYPLQVVSLFSGAGLLDYAFMKEGFEIVFAIDIDEDACKTYRKNIGDHIVCDDICTYPKIDVPETKIIIGGPSCKPFSKARFDYYSEKGKIENHKDSKLIMEYIKWVKSEYANYNIFVLENVPELLTASEGAYLKLIQEELSDFEISYGIVNDVEQGGYQKRKRAFVIGSKIGKIEIPQPIVPKERWKTVGEALSKVDDTWPNQKDVSTPSKETIERMKHVPQGGNWRNIPEYLRTKAKHSNSYRRLALDEPCVTLVNYRKPIIIHPTENRILTVSEAAALSGLDKNFVFEGKLSSKQQQVGNGVPIAMGRAIARAVKKPLLNMLII